MSVWRYKAFLLFSRSGGPMWLTPTIRGAATVVTRRATGAALRPPSHGATSAPALEAFDLYAHDRSVTWHLKPATTSRQAIKVIFRLMMPQLKEGVRSQDVKHASPTDSWAWSVRRRYLLRVSGRLSGAASAQRRHTARPPTALRAGSAVCMTASGRSFHPFDGHPLESRAVPSGMQK